MQRLQRAILISLGTDASALGAEVHQECRSPVLAHVALPLQVTTAAGVSASLLAALQAISSTDIQARLLAAGTPVDHLDEIVLWLLLDLAAADALDTLLCAYEEAATLAWRHFRCAAIANALVLADPSRAEETEALLVRLESLARPLSSLFLAAPVNSEGLSVAPDVFRSHVSVGLRHLLVTSLRHLPAILCSDTPPPPWEPQPQRDASGEGTASLHAQQAWQTPPLLTLGASSYPNPAPRLIPRYAHLWTQSALAALMAAARPAIPPPVSAPADLLPWQPDRLEEALAVKVGPVVPQLDPTAYRTPGYQQLAELLRTLADDKARAEAEIQRAMQGALAPMQSWLKQWQRQLNQRLAADLAAAHGLPDLAATRTYVEACQSQWVRWAEVIDGRLAESVADRSRCESRWQQTQTTLALILGRFPSSDPTAFLRLLFHPGRWWDLIRTYISLPSTIQRYVAEANALLQLDLSCRSFDLLRQHYLAGAQIASDALQQIDALVDGLNTAARQLQAEPLEPWSDAVFDLPAHDQLYQELVGDGLIALQRCLAQTPLLTWPYADAGATLAHLQAFGQQWLAPLEEWGADRFVAYALRDDEERIGHWLKALLAEACPLWPDGAGTPAYGQEIGALVLADPEESPLLPVVRRGWPGVQVTWGRSSDPVAAIRIRTLSEL